VGAKNKLQLTTPIILKSMKNLIIFITFLGLLTPLSAQDLIVIFRDTIPCQIIRMDDNSVTYQIVKNDGTKETNIIARQFVSYYRIEPKIATISTTSIEFEDKASTLEIKDSTDNTMSNVEIIHPTKEKLNYTTFRWTFSSGYAKRLSKEPELRGELSGNKNYGALFENLINGFSWGTEMQYFFNKNSGLSLNVNGVHASTEQSGTTTIPKAYRYIFYDLKIRQRMIYIGPGWTNKLETQNFLFTSNLSLGLLIIAEKHWPVGTEVRSMEEIRRTVSGGIHCGIGSEYKVSSNSAIGLKVGTTLDSVSLFNLGDINFKPLLPVSWSSLVVTAYISFRK